MGLREALASKRSQQTHYDLVIADPSEHEAALQAAHADLRLAQLRDDTDAADAAQAAVDAAQVALQGCLHRILFHPLEPDVFEALITAHPPTKEQEKDGERWNLSTFRPALLAGCAEADLTEAEWAAELNTKRWSHADRDEVFAAALSANLIPRSLSIPKG